jgi:hypothetical protein
LARVKAGISPIVFCGYSDGPRTKGGAAGAEPGRAACYVEAPVFVLRWMGRLLAVPLVWAGELIGWVAPAAAGSLYTIAWWLGGDGQVAGMALASASKTQGDVAALAMAIGWMQRRPRPEIAAMGGLTALQLGRIEIAQQMLEAGRQIGTDRDGLLELLEWLLVTATGDGKAVQELAGRLEMRRDLPPVLARQVLTTQLWEAIQHQRFDEARQRAEHLLMIEDVPQAEMALWALDKREGDVVGAEMHLRQARLEPSHKLSFQILGNISIGFLEEARALLAQLRKLDPDRAASMQAMLSWPQEPAR